MIWARLLVISGTMVCAAGSAALSTEAVEGKRLYPTCHVCHNPEMDPPLGPPMWGVQRRYKKHTRNQDEFVQSVVDFVKAPTLASAIQHNAVKQLGLMPPLPLPDEILKKIAIYIYEEDFPPPCAHWKIAVARAAQGGDLVHAEKDRRMLERFCN